MFPVAVKVNDLACRQQATNHGKWQKKDTWTRPVKVEATNPDQRGNNQRSKDETPMEHGKYANLAAALDSRQVRDLVLRHRPTHRPVPQMSGSRLIPDTCNTLTANCNCPRLESQEYLQDGKSPKAGKSPDFQGN